MFNQYGDDAKRTLCAVDPLSPPQNTIHKRVTFRPNRPSSDSLGGRRRSPKMNRFGVWASIGHNLRCKDPFFDAPETVAKLSPATSSDS